MEPIETMLEYSPPEDIVRADVSKFIVRDELDIGIVPDVPPMTPFDETPIGIHLRDEIAQKEGELLALRELSKSDATTMMPDYSSLPVDLSILDKSQIAYSKIDLDDIWADFLQALHRPPLESKLQSLIDDNSLDIEFANLDTNIPRYTQDEEEEVYDFHVAPYPLGYKNIVKLQLLTLHASPQKRMHRYSPRSEYEFSYVMPMHRKRVRLRPSPAMRCSKPRSESGLTLGVDIPWDPGG
jgi:hypothetical protein